LVERGEDCDECEEQDRERRIEVARGAVNIRQVRALLQAPRVVTGRDPHRAHPEARLLWYGNRTGDWPFHRAPRVLLAQHWYRVLVVDGEVVVVADGIWDEERVPKCAGALQLLEEQATGGTHPRTVAIGTAIGLQEILDGMHGVVEATRPGTRRAARPAGRAQATPHRRFALA